MSNDRVATFADRLNEAMKFRDLKQRDLVERTKLSKQQVSQYVNGKFEAKQTGIYLLAKALDVSETWLMGFDVPTYRIPDEQRGSANSRQLPPVCIPMPEMTTVPLIGHIACGVPTLAEQNIEGHVQMPSTVKGTFALQCVGDSMIGAHIFNGDLVFVREQPEVENGEIAVVVIDDDFESTSTLKRFYRYGSTVVLRAENPTVAELTFEGEEINRVHIAGKAVACLSSLEKMQATT